MRIQGIFKAATLALLASTAGAEDFVTLAASKKPAGVRRDNSCALTISLFNPLHSGQTTTAVNAYNPCQAGGAGFCNGDFKISVDGTSTGVVASSNIFPNLGGSCPTNAPAVVIGPPASTSSTTVSTTSASQSVNASPSSSSAAPSETGSHAPQPSTDSSSGGAHQQSSLANIVAANLAVFLLAA